MKTLIKCYTLTQAESVKMALEAADIDSVVQGRSLIGMAGNHYTVAVSNDDVERAKQVLAELEAADTGE